ncbi:MAG: hypothetical protein ACK4WN_09250 [Aphanizomenon sp.]|jgi:hypothetical protein
MFSSKDWRPERIKAREVHSKWNETLEAKGLDNKARGIQTSKNYKANIGKRSKELDEELNYGDIQASFSTEELERHTRLEEKQIYHVEQAKSRDQAVKKCKEVRDNQSWWW